MTKAGVESYKAIRAYVDVDVDEAVTFYTGKLVKTLLYSVFKEIRLYRGIRGIVSPLHASPMFRPGRREWELGDLVTPVYVKENDEEKLKPVELGGEYIIHIGGVDWLVDKAYKLLRTVRMPLQIKIGEVIVRYRIEKLGDVTDEILEKTLAGDKITLYLKSPTKLFNVYTRSKLPKFNISAVEVLMAPYMLYTRQLSMTESVLLKASSLLGNLIETYYSITTVRPVLIPFNGRKTPAMKGRITYILEARDEKIDELKKILTLAEVAGIGQSRQNGFGTVTWKCST